MNSPREIAAGWALEAQKGITARRQAERDVWVAEDPRHEALLRAAESTLVLVDRHAAQPEILALRQAALSARAEKHRPSARTLVAGMALVLIVAGVVGWTLRFHPGVAGTAPVAVIQTPKPARYSTLIGEQLTVPLADGSTMLLNTASAAEVLYSPSERGIRLLQGQALFTVAHGQAAPFRVYAGDRTITAVGTMFDVRLEGTRVEVGMLEGTVRVDGRRGRSPPLDSLTTETLTAGQVMVALPVERPHVESANVERMTSWRAGLLMFDDTPLDVAVAEVNRYTPSPLTLGDSTLAEYRISGTFKVGEPERFARTITELFPLRIERTRDGRVVLKRKQ